MILPKPKSMKIQHTEPITKLESRTDATLETGNT